MTPFQNNNNFLDSTSLLRDGRLSGTIDASMLCLIRLIDEAGSRTLLRKFFSQSHQLHVLDKT